MDNKAMAYMACSVDGYIAGPGNDLSFLEKVQLEGEDYGYRAFMKNVSCLVMGRNTYDWLTQHAGWPYADKEVWVVSSRNVPQTEGARWYNGAAENLVQQLKSTQKGNIYCDGGKLIQSLLQAGQIDSLIISVIPVLLGQGIPLFGFLTSPQPLQLIEVKSFSSGLVQLHYTIGK
ncbi:MAG: dihydrofolate reductase family protein [Chitinophagaceae bacterium]|jgi:dihydrofolate reductase|nr:dihydrofolate reductase family protein [Chitinophagaceae bacterium]